MSIDEFRLACKTLFGTQRGWQTKAANALGLDPASISRYLSGTIPISGPVVPLLGYMLESAKGKPRKSR